VKQVRIPFVLRIGDDHTVFDLHHVRCNYDDRPFDLPPELAPVANQLVLDHQNTIGFELTNEPAYRLIRAALDKRHNGTGPILDLLFQRTNYFDFVATNLSLDRKLLNNGQTTLREKYVADIGQFETTPLANSLSVMILLVSGPDRVVLLARRGTHVAIDQGCWQVSTGGAMRLAVDNDEHLCPSPFATAQREIAEELGLRVPLEAFRFLGLGVDTRTGEPELLGLATIPLTAQQIRQAFKVARHGNDELTSLEMVPFTLEALVPYLVEQCWCPGDWVACYLALVHEFGEQQVSQHLQWQTAYGVALTTVDGNIHEYANASTSSPSAFRQWRKRAPLPLRQLYGWARRLVAPHYLWTHPEFQRYTHWLAETERWSRTELEAMQLERLQQLLNHSYENVPYYRRIFEERRLKPADIHSLSDLPLLPVLTRKDVRANLQQLVARNVSPDKLYYVMTGGTSGVPLGFYHEKDVSRPHEAAFMYRQWTWAGYRFCDRVALLRPYAFTHTTRSGQPHFWDYCAIDNSLLLSNYLMSQETLPLYLDKLREFKPQFIQSFPSALYVIARYMRDHHIDDLSPRAIFTEFEQLYPAQRCLIEEAFGCPVLAGYGNSERTVDAVECLQRSGYHVGLEYGIVEITDEEGQLLPPGEAGLITSTGLDTHCMPFIRYQTGDMGRWQLEPCACGRELPLLTDIVGRWQHEVVVTHDERYIPITTLNTHNDAFDHVEEYQYYQEKPGELVLKIVPLPTYTEADTGRIQQALLTKLHGAMQIQVVFVPQIPRTRRGKHRMLIQEVPVSFDHYYQEDSHAA
jgi:phenylacetate-CoA ligase